MKNKKVFFITYEVLEKLENKIYNYTSMILLCIKYVLYALFVYIVILIYC